MGISYGAAYGLVGILIAVGVACVVAYLAWPEETNKPRHYTGRARLHRPYIERAHDLVTRRHHDGCFHPRPHGREVMGMSSFDDRDMLLSDATTVMELVRIDRE